MSVNFDNPTYCEEVERFFFEKRGVKGRVSALDFQVMAQWEKAGVPLDLVKRVIDEAFAKNPLITTLRYFEKAMVEAMERRAQAKVGAGENRVELDPVSDDGSLPEQARGFLKNYAQKLNKLSVDAESAFAILCVANKLEALAEAETLPDFETLENSLDELEERLLTVLRALVTNEQSDAFFRELSPQLTRFKQTMPPDVYKQTVNNKLDAKILALFGLSRLSLF
jgi:hypothetical protein